MSTHIEDRDKELIDRCIVESIESLGGGEDLSLLIEKKINHYLFCKKFDEDI